MFDRKISTDLKIYLWFKAAELQTKLEAAQTENDEHKRKLASNENG